MKEIIKIENLMKIMKFNIIELIQVKEIDYLMILIY